MTDDLERRIRAARPLSGHRNLPLTDRAKRELADLVLIDAPGVDKRSHLPYWRRPMAWAAVAAAAAILTVLSFTVFTTPRTYAATPPLLPVTPIAGTAAELLNQLADAAAATADPAPTGDMHIAFQDWALNMVEDPETGGVVAEATVVVPERVVVDRYPDGSLISVTTVGRTLGDSENAAPAADMPPEGTVLSRDIYGPGEYQSIFPSMFPTDAQQVGQYFAPPDEPDGVQDAYNAFSNVRNVLLDQVLGGTQRAAALRYLATLRGIDVIGTVTDRLGRAGIMFRASGADYPDNPEYLVISPGTGKILASETHYIGHDRKDLRSPSVTQYFAWE